MQDLSKEDLAKAESAGFPVVLLILLAVFGTLAAASLPLLLGLVSVLVTGGLIFALSQVMEMSVFVTNMASMIGIGVAVDYSLFVVARYREEVAAGRSHEEARSVAMATSGLAVLFSGLTVIVSLAGLWMVDNQAIRSMALGAMLVVAVAMLGAATLLPLLLGRRVARPGRFARRRAPEPGGSAFWKGWTAGGHAPPGARGRLHVRDPASRSRCPCSACRPGRARSTSSRPTTRRARASRPPPRITGPGASSPIKVVARPAASGEAVRDGDRGRPGRGRRRRAGRLARRRAPCSSPPSRATAPRPTRRRRPSSGCARSCPRSPGGHVDVGGVSASEIDITDLVSGSMWKILLFLLGLSYIVLLVLLRSVVLPAKAVLMNLLSVGAAMGILSLVFDTVDTLTPPLVLAIVFGLSMDYEVFLLSRIRERYEATGDTRRAVAEGLAASARTITSAALIMVAVFGVFIAVGVPSIKQLGLGTAVAIALDATLVRLILVPAAMELLGKWNWYLPRPLARCSRGRTSRRCPRAAA